MQKLIDGENRLITYLRVSVTDRCDFRCVYCMSEDMEFVARKQTISLEETARIINIFANHGVNKVRLTGGEPLVRKNIEWLASSIKQNTAIKQLAITTNGSQLTKLAAKLKSSGVDKLNISLDTLNAVQFNRITRTGDLTKVLAGIDTAIAVGFSNIRLNSVIMRGQNDEQILPLVDYARSKSIDIAFIEEMPLGKVSHNRMDTYISNEEIRQQIDKCYPLIASQFHSGGPADYYQFADSPSRVGFISPHSCNFCADCNRLRLTIQGQLLLCLGQENSLDLKTLLRTGKSDDEIAEAIHQAIQLKPKGHEFSIKEQPIIFRHMSHTGG